MVICAEGQDTEFKKLGCLAGRGRGAKKGGPKMKGYPYGYLKTKKIKNRPPSNSLLSLNVEQNKQLSTEMPKCY
jgi:hypothetical protein